MSLEEVARWFDALGPFDAAAFWVTLRLATLTTLTHAVVSLPLAYVLVRRGGKPRQLVAALVSLPLVLPPTVLGFYLLLLVGPASWMGHVYGALTGGAALAFSLPGLWLGAVIINAPFAMGPFLDAFGALDRAWLEASRTVGAREITTLWRIALPLALPGVVTGLVMTFAHTVGEFGVAIMIGGNLPGTTRTLALSLYDDLQALELTRAHHTAAVLTGGAILATTLVHVLKGRSHLDRR